MAKQIITAIALSFIGLSFAQHGHDVVGRNTQISRHQSLTDLLWIDCVSHKFTNRSPQQQCVNVYLITIDVLSTTSGLL